MVRRLMAALLIVVMPVLAAVPVRAEERPPLKIEIPASIIAAANSQTPPPRTPAPKQEKSHFIAAVAIISAIVVVAVVVRVTYGQYD